MNKQLRRGYGRLLENPVVRAIGDFSDTLIFCAYAIYIWQHMQGTPLERIQPMTYGEVIRLCLHLLLPFIVIRLLQRVVQGGAQAADEPEGGMA